ncbi:DNA-3-methyladenine glycosylase family protein [Microbacterium sp. YY-01]|uniref:DNA-3-methyladenine glycosylase family protein n=1 Tax=Microbacterium sp. YY-01 TaxID=3421634 RepID=UPI003D16DA89
MTRTEQHVCMHYRPGRYVHLTDTLAIHRRGLFDPVMVIDGGTVWRALATDNGAVTLALRTQDDEIIVDAWAAPGTATEDIEQALDAVPDLCGAGDNDEGFAARQHPVVAAAAHKNPGLRLSSVSEPLEPLVAAILEQKVTTLQAYRAWRYVVSRYGSPAPGPTPRPLFAPPGVAQWRSVPSWEWHRAGVEPPQSRTIMRVMARGTRIAEALRAADGGHEAERILRGTVGVGVWTAAETRIRAHGDADAVSFGDYHLAHEIGYALTGCRTDDDGMRELLAPWAGHRQRVIRLLRLSGPRQERRGARLAPQDHRRH